MEDYDLYDLIIVGGGPAGLSAAIYGGRARLRTLVLERGAIGGLAITTFHIDNYPGFPESIAGPDLMQRMEEQARKFGAEIEQADITGLEGPGGLGGPGGSELDGSFAVITSGGKRIARAVIVATGTEPMKLGVPGEEEFRGRGVSYCATCDGAFFRDKHVIVVGGGDSAIEEAIFLTRFASAVTVVHRRDALRATKVVQERAFANPKIAFEWSHVVGEITGENRVEGVRLRSTKTGEVKELPADGVFIYVGSRPNTGFLMGGPGGDNPGPAQVGLQPQVKLDERGYIITDEAMRTNVPGLFAAGDVRQKGLRQIVTAVSDGAIAAVEAEKYIDALA
ncbi:MAG: thioredoxin-disulfide reductase [Firmicutes bacterium]|nr:thioredoxin-disulfide reductase [Bacillota bacterium]